jgi:hypothetical protein
MFSIRKICGAPILLGALLWSVVPGVSVAGHHDHQHDGGGVAKLTLNNGRKWSTDESLRQGMSRIRDTLEANLPAIHTGKTSPAQFEALAKKVNGELAFIVKNCKLDPQADAMLHLVLADIIAGADGMAGKDKGLGRREGALKIVQALESYAAYFDHPGWRAPKTPH